MIDQPSLQDLDFVLLAYPEYLPRLVQLGVEKGLLPKEGNLPDKIIKSFTITRDLSIEWHWDCNNTKRDHTTNTTATTKLTTPTSNTNTINTRWATNISIIITIKLGALYSSHSWWTVCFTLIRVLTSQPDVVMMVIT